MFGLPIRALGRETAGAHRAGTTLHESALCVVIVGQLGFAYDGVTLYVRLMAPGRVAGPHVSLEADRLRINRAQRERTARRRATGAFA